MNTAIQRDREQSVKRRERRERSQRREVADQLFSSKALALPSTAEPAPSAQLTAPLSSSIANLVV
jgi:hypothetical protein